VSFEVENSQFAFSVPKWLSRARLRAGPMPPISARPAERMSFLRGRDGCRWRSGGPRRAALDEIEHGVARLEAEGLAPRHVEGLAAGLAVAALGDADQRHVGDAEVVEDGAGGGELARAAVDDDEIGPGPPRPLLAPRLRLAPFATLRARCSFRRRLKRRSSTSRIMPKSSPGAMSDLMLKVR
jgi:hypothetical protein